MLEIEKIDRKRHCDTLDKLKYDCKLKCSFLKILILNL